MLAICCFVIFVGIAATPLNKVLLSEDLAESYGAKCLDGTPAGYYIREVRGSSDWVFFLQGGGLCVEPVDCLSRSKSQLGSSKYWAATYQDDNNVLNSDPLENPFSHFNAVYVPYCSGDTFLGMKKSRNVLLGGLYTNGHLILEAIVDHLHNTTSMGNKVDRVLLSGDSAGGIGALHNADWLTQTIRSKFGFADAVVKASPQAGLFFPSRPSVGICLYEEYWLLGARCPRVEIFESWYVRHVQNAFVNSACKSKLGDSTRCWDAGILARYVETPLFLAQNRYDQNQMNNEFLCFGCKPDVSKMSQKDKEYMTYFGNHTEATLRDLADNFGHSVFMPNCFAHTFNLCMRAGPKVSGFSYSSALRDWFFHGKHHALYDDCGDLPCSTTCGDCQGSSALATSVDMLV